MAMNSTGHKMGLIRPGLVPLEAHELHLWLAQVPDRPDDALVAAQRALLNTDERTRMHRFHTEALQRRYLTTRAMVRTVLSSYASVLPAHWEFAVSSHGRPHIAHPAKAAPSLRFNISHTERLVAMLVGSDRELGVDVESAGGNAPLIVAEKYFAPAESLDMARLPAALRHSRFWDYWTLKESYVKARGLGLSMPLDAFWFSFDSDDRIQMTIGPDLDDRSERWQFWQFVFADQLLAVCAELVPTATTTLSFWSIVPTRTTHQIKLPHLRRSLLTKSRSDLS